MKIHSTSRKSPEKFVFGPYVFDIDKATKIIEENQNDSEKVEKITVPCQSLKVLSGFIRIDKDHAKTTDLTKPGIAVLTEEGALPIDGWHRASQLIENNVEEMSFFLIKDRALIKSFQLQGPRKKKGRLL